MIGFYLLLAFGQGSALGAWLAQGLGLQLVFSFEGLLLASLLVNLPFMVQPIQRAFAALPNSLREAAWVSGLSVWQTFWRIELPLAWPGLLAGVALTVAHTLGEFGVVLMVGGSISRRNADRVDRDLRSRAGLRPGGGAQHGAGAGAVVAAGAGPRFCRQPPPSRRAQPAGALMPSLQVRLHNAAPIPLAAEFECAAGELIALVGPSGSGKTSCCAPWRCCCERKPPGTVHASATNTGSTAPAASHLTPQQRHVGLVFQHYALFPHLSALENVSLAPGPGQAAGRRVRCSSGSASRAGAAPASAAVRRSAAARRAGPRAGA